MKLETVPAKRLQLLGQAVYDAQHLGADDAHQALGYGVYNNMDHTLRAVDSYEVLTALAAAGSVSIFQDDAVWVVTDAQGVEHTGPLLHSALVAASRADKLFTEEK